VLGAPRRQPRPAPPRAPATEGLVEVAAWEETQDPYALVASLLDTAAGAGGGPAPEGQRRLLVDAGLPARHLLALQRALGGRSFGLATEVLRDLRIVKTPDEIELLRRAAHAADRVVARIAAGPLVGRTEAEVSRQVRDLLIEEGHEEATFAIVAAGPDGASPHHGAGARRIGPGDPIVLDIGGTVQGYGSDITRMLWVTGADAAVPPSAEFLEAFELVRAANANATAAVRPGARCGDLDAIARTTIREGGFGDAFLHRLGHGIGLEGHEDPYLVAGNDEALRAGSAFSIEPGIYLVGRFGVRIEDIVVCGADGPDVLNEAPRELLVVPG
jgi:Xaa-Pro aminopeptidase